MPVKYKINYFDRDLSQSGKSQTLSKAERRRMLKDIFESQEKDGQNVVLSLDEMYQNRNSLEIFEPEYEEYEEEIEIKVSDIGKYIKDG